MTALAAAMRSGGAVSLRITNQLLNRMGTAAFAQEVQLGPKIGKPVCGRLISSKGLQIDIQPRSAK